MSVGDLMMDAEECGEKFSHISDAPRRGRHPVFYIANWIFFSNVTILFNKWLLDSAGFRYPAILTCWHLTFATLATQLLARTTRLLDGRFAVNMNGRLYFRAIVPIGLFYSFSLVCSNLVYLYLSVAFTQMLKAGAPIATFLLGIAFDITDRSLSKFLNLIFIVLGIVLASLGEINFHWAGFLYQLGAILFESMRLIMIEKLLRKKVEPGGSGRPSNVNDEDKDRRRVGGNTSNSANRGMDPLVSLYYFAPVCAVMNAIIALASELRSFRYEDLARTGYGILLLNAAMAFLLNVSSVLLIGKTSSLAVNLTSIFKNILIIIASIAIWGTSITLFQLVGYAIALGGMFYFSHGSSKDFQHHSKRTAAVFFDMARPVPRQVAAATSVVRRALLMTGLLFVMATSWWLMFGSGRFDKASPTSVSVSPHPPSISLHHPRNESVAATTTAAAARSVAVVGL